MEGLLTNPQKHSQMQAGMGMAPPVLCSSDRGSVCLGQRDCWAHHCFLQFALPTKQFSFYEATSTSVLWCCAWPPFHTHLSKQTLFHTFVLLHVFPKDCFGMRGVHSYRSKFIEGCMVANVTEKTEETLGLK